MAIKEKTKKPKRAPKKAPNKAVVKKPPVKPRKRISFEEATPVPLNKSERQNLSRSLILKWFRNERFAKLKGLQDVIFLASVSEQLSIKERITKRTIKELGNFNKKLNKLLPKEKKVEIANEFSDQLFNVITKNDDQAFKKKLGEMSTKDMALNTFYAFLGMHGGSTNIVQLQKWKRSKVLQIAFRKKPGLEREYDEMAETGDIKGLASFIKKHVPALKNTGDEEVYFSLIAMNDTQSPVAEMLGKIPFIGEGIKQIVKWGGKAQEIVMFPFFRKVARRINVNLSNLINVASLTLSELNARDKVLQKHKGVLYKILEKTKDGSTKRKIKRHIKYIADVKLIRTKIGEVKGENETYIRRAISEKINKHKDLNEDDKRKILSRVELDAIRVQTFLPTLIYGAQGENVEKSKYHWISFMLARGFKFAKAKRIVFGGKYTTGRFNAAYMWKTWRDQNMRRFNESMQNRYGSDSVLKENFDRLRADIDNYNVSSPSDTGAAAKARDLHARDSILSRYNDLSVEYSRELTKRAKNLQGAEGTITRLFKKASKLAKIEGKNIDDIFVSTNALTRAQRAELKLPHGTKSISMFELHKAWATSLTELQDFQQLTKNNFTGMAGDMEGRVLNTYDKKWIHKTTSQEVRELSKKSGTQHDEVMKHLSPGRKLLRRSLYVGIPLIAIAPHAYSVMQGNARLSDVKWYLFDIGVGLVPIASTINDGYQLYTGKDSAGNTLSDREKLIVGLSFGAGLVADFFTFVLPPVGLATRWGINLLRSGKRIHKIGVLARSVKGVRKGAQIAKIGKLKNFRQADELFNIGRKLDDAKVLNKVDELAPTHRLYDDAQRFIKLKNLAGIENYGELAGMYGRIAKNLDDIARAKGVMHASMYRQVGMQIAKYMGMGAMGLVSYSVLTGGNPFAEKERKGFRNHMSSLYSGGKKALTYSYDFLAYKDRGKAPIEDVINSYVKRRVKFRKFEAKMVALQKTNNPNKKKEIEDLCAANWENSHVQAWAFKYKELDIKRIMNRVKDKLIASRSKLGGLVGGRRPANLDLLSGKRGGANKEIV